MVKGTAPQACDLRSRLFSSVHPAAQGSAWILHFIPEGLAVRTLHLRGVGLVGSHLNLVQSAVVFFLGMVGAVVYGTGNALIFLICHDAPPEI